MRSICLVQYIAGEITSGDTGNLGNIAPYEINPKAGPRLWMCRLTFDPPPREANLEDGKKASRDDHPETIFHKYIKGMAVRPLAKAYVLLIPRPDDYSEPAPDASHAIFCRTSENGEILRIQESDIDSDVPASDSAHWQTFQPDAVYDYIWSLNKKRFKKLIQEARQSLSCTRTLHDFSSFHVASEREAADPHFELLTDNSHRMYVERLLYHALVKDCPGYRRFFLNLSPPPFLKDLKDVAPYVFARRRVADALYCGELIHCHTLGLRQRAAKQFGVFSYVQHICDRAENHELTGEADSGECAKKDETEEQIEKQGEHQTYREMYFEYAYQCARRVDVVSKKLFETAVKDVTNNLEVDTWWEAAKTIFDKTGQQCVHPSMYVDLRQGTITRLMRPMTPEPVINYFDYYRFGSEKATINKAQSTKRYADKVSMSLTKIRDKVARMMSKNLYYDLLICLGNYSDDEDAEKLHARYLELAAQVEYDWWDHFEPEPDVLSLLSAYLDDIGKFPDKVFEQYAAHFSSYEHVAHHNNKIDKKLGKAKDFLSKAIRWTQYNGGELVELKHPDGFDVHYDPSTGLVKVIEDTEVVAEGHLLVERKNAPAQWKHVRGALKKVAPPKNPSLGKAFKLTMAPEYKEFNSIPSWLSAFGIALSLSASLVEMYEKIKSDEASTGEYILATTKIAKDTFQLVSATGDALHSVFPYAQNRGLKLYTHLAEKLEGPGFVLEAVVNLHDGATILMLGENSQSALAARKGEIAVGYLQEVKGLLLVGSVVPGAVAAGAAVYGGATAAAVMAAALGPLGVGLAIGGVFVAALDLAIRYIEGESYTDPIQKALDEAFQREFPDRKERTFDSLNAFSKTVDILLANYTKEAGWLATTPSSKASTSH